MKDVIVVGGGPAGAETAYHCAKAGLDVLLLEKKKIPRDKLCGGGITLKVLREIDHPIEMGIFERVTKAARVYVGESVSTFGSEKPLVYMTSRDRFDSELVRRAADAGAEVNDKSAVSEVKVRADEVEVRVNHGQLESRTVVGADGINSLVAESTGLRTVWKPNQVALAMEADFKVGSKAVEDFMTENAYFDLYFGPSTAGYGWIFPKHDRLTVGIGCELDRLSDAREMFQHFVRGLSLPNGSSNPTSLGHLLPIGGQARTKSYGDKVLLVGDSAGFAEPLLGEGIYFAVRGARIAAETLTRALELGDVSRVRLREYEEAWKNDFGKDFEVAYDLARLAYLENFDMTRAVRFLARPEVWRCMIALMEGEMKYRDVKRKLMLPYLLFRLARLFGIESFS